MITLAAAAIIVKWPTVSDAQHLIETLIGMVLAFASVVLLFLVIEPLLDRILDRLDRTRGPATGHEQSRKEDDR